ncbi:MAG: peptide chain release factor N(5)-glutamine methyltransferase [Kiritimatiellae bacterium]|nr:peptide chain release factor N(5)-glutamine methyltransferase [Kiritimatiellia bacterium]
MLWGEVIGKTAHYLEGKGVAGAQTAAELLAARLLKTGRGFLGGFALKEAPEPFLEAMRRGMARLAAGEPVQYVIGEWDFRRLTLKCDRRALIPRPETEELVSLVLKSLKGGEVVIDVGTGTGAIVLSLAQEAPSPKLLIGTDVSEDAIALARENAERTGLGDKVELLAMDGLEEFDEPQFVDVIVSNPPYIRSADIATLSPQVRDFEPRLALDGGENGLDFYERYLGDALNLLKPGGRVFFEIGEDQGEPVRELMASFGFSAVEIGRDFAGHDRYASAVLE